MDAARTQTTFSLVAATGALFFGFLVTPSSEAKTVVQPGPHALTAAEILEKSLVARGGRDAMAKIDNMQWFGTVKVTESGITGRFESFSARPARERFKLIWDGDFYTMEVNGGTVTETFPSESHEVTGSERDQELLDANFDVDSRWQELFPTVKLNGLTTFSGAKAYAIEMHSTTGNVRVRYIDAESFLPLGEDRDLAVSERHRNNEPETNGRDHYLVRMVYSDYRTVMGVKYSFHWARLATGHPNLPEMVYQADRVDANVRWK